MSRPDRIDPQQILSYLQELGYSNISKKQLCDFVYDLKKLIKYDSQFYNNDKENKTSENYPEDDSSDISKIFCKCNENELKKTQSDTRSRKYSTSSSIDSECSTSLTESCFTSLSNDEEFSRLKENCKKTTKSNQASSRPQSSFIRPKKFHPAQHGTTYNGAKKSDPVKLYQKYKEMWNQQKAPGENKHSDLRWMIREKMLGADPQIRPISRGSLSNVNK